MYLKTFPYAINSLNEINLWKFGQNWPTVYIIHNDREAYVGQTIDLSKRTKQHLLEQNLNKMEKMTVITDKTFNKSVVIDLESFLIEYMDADGQFRMKNGNFGISDHNYFNKEIYKESFINVWELLKKEGLVKKNIQTIINSNAFKYSPYKALSNDQLQVAESIINLIGTYRPGTKMTILVYGAAGTGKTILATYLSKLFVDLNNSAITKNDELQSEDFNSLSRIINKDRIGLVIPQKALAATIESVFDSVEGLDKNMVVRPKSVYKNKYDILIVDEAHRLQRRKSLGQGFARHDAINKELGLDINGTQLDWIIKCSDIQILFYDPAQSIRPSDIDKNQFMMILEKYDCKVYDFRLFSQFRCKAGEEYINYIRSIISSNNKIEKKQFIDYDIKIFNHMDDMWKKIHEKEAEYGLCRTVSGIGWNNASKDDQVFYMVSIEGKEYRFRKTAVNWVADTNSIDEIGDIHKIQGYDLCYAGVIFGPEIDYDENKQKIVIDPKQYYDRLGKQGIDESELTEYIINIYTTLMTRGIYGTYVYAVNDKLRCYFKHWFEEV